MLVTGARNDRSPGKCRELVVTQHTHTHTHIECVSAWLAEVRVSAERLGTSWLAVHVTPESPALRVSGRARASRAHGSMIIAD